MVRQEGVGGLVEAELQNLHPGQTEAVAQLDDVRGDHAQVLGDDRHDLPFILGQRRVKRLEKILARAGHPLSRFCGGTAKGDLIVSCKPAEMVEAHDVHQVKDGPESLDPPLIPCLFVRAPLVEGISPQLACRRKVIRRNPCYHGWQTVLVQKEKFRIGPCIRAVIGDKDRDIANNGDPLVMSIVTEFVPLPEEQELVERVADNGIGMLGTCLVHSGFFALSNSLIPIAPGAASVGFLDRHEQDVIIQPRGILRSEFFKFRAVLLRGRRQS